MRCGLEIHQQLLGTKLFCRCPCIVSEGSPDFVVKRKFRAVVGETGEVDSAAVHELLRGRTILYEGFNDSSCAVDFDEAPPLSVSDYALMTALQVSLMFNAVVVDEFQVMRKTVVDGSNTSGFQRTSLVARNGSIKALPFENFISIPTVVLEEDSARIIEVDNLNKTAVKTAIKTTAAFAATATSVTTTAVVDDLAVYRLDRLGIPLLEISTGAELTSPEMVSVVAERIGLLLRSTGRIVRGLGSIRQDVNVSISGGSRVEIKGVQDLSMISAVVELEAFRQHSLLAIRDELSHRGVFKVDGSIFDVSKLFVDSASNVIQFALKNSGVVLACKLSGFAGIIGRNISPSRRFGSELSDCAKIIASVGGIFHSDELPSYGIVADEVLLLKKELHCGVSDAFVIVADSREKADKALHAVIARAREALVGVPSEVRKPLADGSSSFLRPLSGSARMYPETDVLPVRISGAVLSSIVIPELIDDKISRYLTLGLSKDLAVLVARSERWVLFDEFVKSFSQLSPSYIAELVMSASKIVKSQKNVDVDPSDDDLRQLFNALSNGRLAKESVVEVLAECRPVVEVLSDVKYLILEDEELSVIITRIVKENISLPLNALIGRAMQELRGKAQGSKIVEFVKFFFEKREK